MTDGNDNLDTQRFQKLRDAMSAKEIERLRARFKQDPHSLSADEVGVLYLVTRERIRGFEGKARRKLENEKGSSGTGSAE